MADNKIPLPLVAKCHAACSAVFAAIFIFASFGLPFPITSPAALLNDWDVNNPSLMFTVRVVAGVLVGAAARAALVERFVIAVARSCLRHCCHSLL